MGVGCRGASTTVRLGASPRPAGPVTQVNLTGDGDDPVRVGAAFVTPTRSRSRRRAARRTDLHRGRGAGAVTPNVVVLSDGLWKRRFGARDDVVRKQQMLVNGLARRKSSASCRRGFMCRPTSSWTPRSRRQLWLPARLDPTNRGQPRATTRPRGSSPASRSRARDASCKALTDGEWRAGLYPDAMRFRRVRGQADRRSDRGGCGRRSLLVFGAVGFLLLMACANVANLLLVARGRRGRARSPMRSALGAGRWRLVTAAADRERACSRRPRRRRRRPRARGQPTGSCSPARRPRRAELGDAIDRPRVILFAVGAHDRDGACCSASCPRSRSARVDSRASRSKTAVAERSGRPRRQRLRGALVVAEIGARRRHARRRRADAAQPLEAPAASISVSTRIAC